MLQLAYFIHHSVVGCSPLEVGSRLYNVPQPGPETSFFSSAGIAGL